MDNVYLIGMMGAGKTVTGEALSELTRRQFVDLDRIIQERAKSTVNEIFKKEGEQYFRKLEEEALKDVAKKHDLIVATSGGVVLNQQNVETMKETGHVIYLSASLDTLWERVQNKKDRPLLHVSNPRETLSNLYQMRSPLYVSASGDGITINTEKRPPEAIAKEILEKYFVELE